MPRKCLLKLFVVLFLVFSGACLWAIIGERCAKMGSYTKWPCILFIFFSVFHWIHYRQIWRLLKGNFECQLPILPLCHVEVTKTMVCLLGKLTLTHNRLMAFYPGGPVPEETFTHSHPS